jgi:hypothetical protein
MLVSLFYYYYYFFFFWWKADVYVTCVNLFLVLSLFSYCGCMASDSAQRINTYVYLDRHAYTYGCRRNT